MTAVRRTLHRQAAELRDRVGFDRLPSVRSVPIATTRSTPVAPCAEPIERCTDVDAGGVPGRIYEPAAVTPGAGLLVWFHGGGFVLGSLDTHDCLCRRLANAGRFRVLSVGYRLAPEHPFPAGPEDAVTALRWAATDLAGPEAIAVGGDSAGGTMAAVAANDAGVALAHQVLVYPVTDCTMSQPSYAEADAGFPLTAAAMAWFVEQYLPTGVDPRDPSVSPLFAPDDVLAAAPPTLVVTAEVDPLRDEGEAYAARLRAAGVATSHVRFAGMPHGFLGFPDDLDDAKAAVALVATAVAARLQARAHSCPGSYVRG